MLTQIVQILIICMNSDACIYDKIMKVIKIILLLNYYEMDKVFNTNHAIHKLTRFPPLHMYLY